MTTRVVHVTEEQLRTSLVAAAGDCGLNIDWLDRHAAQHGHRWVASWLEDHNFWPLADEWLNTAFLCGWPTEPTE